MRETKKLDISLATILIILVSSAAFVIPYVGAYEASEGYKEGLKDPDKDQENDKEKCEESDSDNEGKYTHNCESDDDFEG